MGIDPLLIDPENGNFQVAENSPAQGYGCQTFGGRKEERQEKSAYLIPTERRSMIEVSGAITTDTFWNADTVLVRGTITIEDNALLTIAPNSKILFEDYYGIHVVNGSISAVGTADERIVFSSLQPELFSFDESYDGAWQGVFFDNVPADCAESRFEFCLFEYGKAVSEHRVQGGAVYALGSSKLTFENCIFRYNAAYFGGAFATEYFANPMIMSSLFYQNYDFVKGSALFLSNSYPKLINNTIVDNHSFNDEINEENAAVHTFFSKPKLYNNIIRGNFTSYLENLQVRESKFYYTRFNNIQQDVEGFYNLDLPAEFFNFAEEDFSLMETSPCVDAGFVFENYSFPEFDLAGNDRISGNHIDMGAFEYQTDTVSPQDIMPVTAITMQLYPNPFNPQSTISFTISETSHVQLTVFNSKGQKIKTLLDEKLAFGEHVILWNGKNDTGREIASGIYFFQLKMNNVAVSYRKGVLLK